MEARKSLLMVAVAVALGGCVEVVEEQPVDTPPTQITDVNQGSNVTSVSASAATVGTDSVDLVNLIGQGAGAAVPVYRASLVGSDPLLGSLAEMAGAMSQIAAADAIKALTDETRLCDNGGTVRIQKDTDIGTGAQVTAYTYNDCRSGNVLLNGNSSMSVLALSVKVRLGGGNGVFQDGNDLLVQRLDGSSNIVETLRLDVTFGMANESTDTTTTVWRMSTNGRARSITTQITATYGYDNFRAVRTRHDSVAMGSDVLNGTVNLDWSSGGQNRSVTLAYENFAVVTDDRNATYSYVTADGTVTLNFRPDDTCNGAKVDGRYSIATNTAVKRVKATGKTVAGEQVINGAATITYNADGTVKVVVNGVTQIMPDIGTLEGLCPLPGLG